MSADKTEEQLKEWLDLGRLDEVIAYGDGEGGQRHAAVVAPLVETAKRRKALIAKFQGDGTGARTVTCPSCRLKLRVVSEHSQSVSCYGCGAITELASLRVVGTRSGHLPESGLTLLTEGTIDGTSVQVIGRVGYVAETLEYDSEDKDYESGRWSWEEWSLLTASGVVWYLCSDSEGYSLAQPFTPSNPSVPRSHLDRIDVSEAFPPHALQAPSMLRKIVGAMRIQEWGEASITAAEGELSWVPRSDEVILYAECGRGGSTIGVEWRRDKSSGQDIEAEFYQSRPVTYEELLQAFPIPELVNLYESERRIRAGRVIWSIPYFVIGVSLLVGAAVFSDSGVQIFNQSVSLASTRGEGGYLMGPVHFQRPGQLYRLSFGASIPDNSDVWIGVELLDAEKTTINAPEAEFWRESGYEDGEHYSESDLNRSKLFRLSQPGYYYLRLYSEVDPGKEVSGSATVSVTEGVRIGFLYAICGLLCLAIGVFVRIISPKPRSRV